MKISVTLRSNIFARVRHWHERHGLSYVAYHRSQDPAYFPNAQGMPAVIRFEQPDNKPVSLTPLLQAAWYEEIKKQSNYSLSRADYLKCWKNLTSWDRAFTNNAGTEQGYADYIQDINIGAEPMKLIPTIANGATIQILGDKVWRFGAWAYPFAVGLGHWFAATNSTVEPVPLGRVEPFTFNGGYDTPVPLLGNLDHAFIDADWIEFTKSENNFPYFNNVVGRTE